MTSGYSPVTVRGRSYSSSDSTASSSPKLGGEDRKSFGTPRVEVGSPCLKCGPKCSGLLLHVWRKICINCRCPRESHQVTFNNPLKTGMDRLTLTPPDEKPSYCWQPQGASEEMVKMYMNSLPYGYIPICGTEGESKRNEGFLMQMPIQDVDPDACSNLSDVEKKRLVKIAEKNKSRACGVGNLRIAVKRERKICCECEFTINPGTVFISAGRAPPNQAWHPACFQCTTCKSLLVDLIYFYHEETKKVYCGRHFAELKIPRCFGCDELIFTDTFTQAEGKDWHKNHFCCERCDKQLHGSKYGCANEKVLCVECYNKYAAEDCARCHLTILLGVKKVRKEGLVFHEECFVCKRCRESFNDRNFYLLENDLVCDECIQPVAQCSFCKEGILPTMDHLRHGPAAWHVKCFTCKWCDQSLVDKNFHEYSGNVLCKECYLRKVSKKCNRCFQTIESKGVQYNFGVYHPECFTCSQCSISLQDIKVYDKNGDPYCGNCILKLAKRCHACQGPITSRHTIYKRKTYHLNCFKCTQCSYPIGNKPFYETSLNDVLCEACAGNVE